MAEQLRASRSMLHSVPEIERALGSIWASAHESRDAGGQHVLARTSVLNLVVVTGDEQSARWCAETISGTAGRHASRSLILSTKDLKGPAGLDARIEALALTSAGRAETGTETIHISAHGETGRHLASIIVPLLVRDLPVALWWPVDPPFGSRRADELLPIADRLIVDGSAWSGDGLGLLGRLAVEAQERHLVVADWALLRQARWREALASVYDPPDLRPHLGAVRRIEVEYAATDPGDQKGTTNVVRPLYHVAWLASRLGMTVAAPLRRENDGRRVATLRQKDHAVNVILRPVVSDLGAGSTARIEIVSRLRGAELIGTVAAGDRTVQVSIQEDGRERVRRSYLAPRLTDVDLLSRAVEEGAADSLAGHALATANRLLGVDSGSHNTTDEHRNQDDD